MKKQVNNMHSTLSLQGRRNTINIGINVIRLLGELTHVCIMQNVHNNSLAVMPCDAKDVMSFHVPDNFISDRNSKFTVHSKQFVKSTMSSCNLDIEKLYVFSGQYVPEKNAVVFFVKQQEEK